MIVLLAFIGLAAGFAVSSGVFALITILGVIPRMAERFGLASRTYLMETVVVLGGMTGTILTVYEPQIPLGTILGAAFLVILGIFAGVYIGAFGMALAEALKVVPILCKRTNLKHGIAVLITAIALGKGIGTLYQMYIIGGS